MDHPEELPEVATATPVALRPLTPEDRWRSDTPEIHEPLVPLRAGEHTWYLPYSGVVRGPIGTLRDKLHTRMIAETGDPDFPLMILEAAWHTLNVLYDVSLQDVMAIAREATFPKLLEATTQSLFGNREDTFGYTDYVELTLLANGFNPYDMPQHLVGRTVQALELVGKAIDQGKILDAVKWLNKRRKYTQPNGL